MPRLLVRNNAPFIECPVQARLPKQRFLPVRQLKSFASFARRTSTAQRPLRFRIPTTRRLFHIAGQPLLFAWILTSFPGVTVRADPGAEAGKQGCRFQQGADRYRRIPMPPDQASSSSHGGVLLAPGGASGMLRRRTAPRLVRIAPCVWRHCRASRRCTCRPRAASWRSRR